MVTHVNFKKKGTSVVGTYKIDAGNDVSFTVILKENENGLREFEINVSQNANGDDSVVLDHPFYQNFVLPWTYRQVEIKQDNESTPTNVIDISKYRKN